MSQKGLMPLPFLGTVDFYVEDFKMHFYHKGNLRNPALKQSPNAGRSRKRAGLHREHGRGRQSPFTAQTSDVSKCCRPAHRLRSQHDCPLQAAAIHHAQSSLTQEAGQALANASTAAPAHKTLPRC